MHGVLRSPVLVARAAELAAARSWVVTASGGLLVTGEAGIGKTRLLGETVDAARAAGRTVLTGRALPGGGVYRPLAEALLARLDAADRPARPDPAASTDPSGRHRETGSVRGPATGEEPPGRPIDLGPYRPALERLRSAGPPESGVESGAGTGPDQAVVLGEGIRRLLAGSLLVVEDLHWADADTVAVIDYLAGAGAPVAATTRPGAVADRLRQAPGMREIALRPLDAAGVSALAAACGRPLLPDEIEALHARSAGLPFAVLELLAAPDRVPPTLTALVAERLAAVPDRAVLEAAAVLGQEPDWMLAGSLAGLSVPATDAALRAATAESLLVSDHTGLRWSHALTREAVLTAVPAPIRAALAARAAQALGDTPRAAELLREAGRADAAAALRLRLARREVSRGALRAAAEHLAEADRAGPGPVTAADVLRERVATLTLTGRATEALALGAAGVDELTGSAHAELCLRLARTAITAGRWAEAEQYVERAGRPGDPRSAVLRADAAFGAGDTAAAAELAEQAADAAADDAATLCEALGVLARTRWRTDIAATTAAFRRAAQVAAEHGLRPARIAALHGAGMMEALDEDSCPTLLRARELAAEAGMLAQLASSDIIRADLVMMCDGPLAAEVHARVALDTATRLRLTSLADIARVQLAACRAGAGDSRGAEALLAATPLSTSGNLAQAAAVRGLGALVEHDLPTALAAFDERIGLILDDQATPILAPVGAWVLLHTMVAGDSAARARVTTHPGGLSRSIHAALRYSDAVDAGAAGDGAAATAALAEGDALLGARAWWRRQLRLPVLDRAVRDGWGDPVAWLRADLAAHEAIGADAQARTCRDLLRAAGAPVRGRRSRHAVPPALRAFGVTGRELEVLRLVAEGLTNAEIAARLVLSRRTVETHVANLLAKTGAARRAELREHLREAR